MMHLKGKLVDQVYGIYQTFHPDTSVRIPAIHRYTGLVFRQLHLDEYTQEQWTYIDEHVRILSAMYGVVHPFSRIWSYRLDYTMQCPNLELRKIWSKSILDAFRHEDLILDLASYEYGTSLSSLKKNRHQVIFLESIDTHEKIISANAKKARGMLLDFLIRNRITDLSGLRIFEEDGYRYQIERSNDTISVFVKGQ